MVLVPPRRCEKELLRTIGRGQYAQIKEFVESNSINNIFVVTSTYDGIKLRRINSFCIIDTGDWNKYSELTLYSEELELTKNLFKDQEKQTIKKEKSMKTNATMSGLKKRLMSQFLPELSDDLGISMDGNICVFKGDDAVSINSNYELVNYPKEMAFKCGLYLLRKPLSDIKSGDIIKVSNSYNKVISVDVNKKEVKCLTYSGYKSTKVTAKDGLLNTNNVQVVLNIFGDQVGGMNPMMMMLMADNEEGNNSFKNMLPFMMMSQQQGTLQGNMFGGMNPMMMYMMMGQEEMDPMMMMCMMGGMGNMFQQPTQMSALQKCGCKAEPNTTPTVVAQPSVEDLERFFTESDKDLVQ